MDDDDDDDDDSSLESDLSADTAPDRSGGPPPNGNAGPGLTEQSLVKAKCDRAGTTGDGAFTSREHRAAFNADLVARIRDGDRDAVNQFCALHGPRIVALLRLKQCPQDLAEDISQSTLMLVLYEKIPKGDPQKPETLGSYVMGIANNLLLADKRRMRPIPDTDRVEEALGPSVAFVEHYAQGQLLEIVQDAIARMPTPRYAAVLREWFLEGRSREHIAERHDVDDLAHVSRIVHRAKKQFFAIVGEHHELAVRQLLRDEDDED